MKKHKPEENQQPEEKQIEGAKVRKVYTPRFYLMILSAITFFVGIGLFVIYYFSLNMVFGVSGVVMAVGSIFVFRYYWKKEDSLSVEHIGGVQKDKANSLNIYPDKVEFANVYEPEGFPMQCVNLRKKFYVNIWDEASKKLVPFVLPDQQYYDPKVFAQRVLGLPAHRKLFERKPKLLQKLKTALLVCAIGIVWLLILTTTGAG